ncbi:MAG: NusA-like transcription termination signal-binding factor [Euryarchaeota archaeon]|nr:NusA-like transcription termination signal-binding factor [Euryarchaeota archaeon]
MQQIICFKERRYIEELRILTKSTAIDCIIDDNFDRVIYIIRKGDMGFAIGKRGENIRQMQRVLGKRVEMVEEASDLNMFIGNILKPACLSSVSVDDESGKIKILVERKRDLGIAIGKGGSNVEKVRLLCKRFFGKDISDVLISGSDESEN